MYPETFYQTSRERGFTLTAVLFLIALLSALLTIFTISTQLELASTKATSDANRGFYAAEAGLNLRSEQIREMFVDYHRPTGTSPSENSPCTGNNLGAGDFACSTVKIGKRDVTTWVEEASNNPVLTTIPIGEPFERLSAQEYRYNVFSMAKRTADGKTEAQLEMRIRSRLVPLFQFAAFYNKDLEISPLNGLILSGPVHANGDIYLDAGHFLKIKGQITTSGDIWRGYKHTPLCRSFPVQLRLQNYVNFDSLIPNCLTTTLATEKNLGKFGDNVMTHIRPLTIPSPGEFDPDGSYWNKADLRLILEVDHNGEPSVNKNGSSLIKIINADHNVDWLRTGILNYICHDTPAISSHHQGRSFPLLNNANNNPAVGYDTSLFQFYDRKEKKLMRLMEVDLDALLNCAHQFGLLDDNKKLDDETEGGLVLYLSIFKPASSNPANGYGIRIRDAEELQANTSGAPQVKGLTVVSNQAVYTWGSYNVINKIPAAIMADSWNVLSDSWKERNRFYSMWQKNYPYYVWYYSPASDTVVNAAVVSGTPTTGNVEGTAGQFKDPYSGGLQNLPRFHERWRHYQYDHKTGSKIYFQQSMTYKGSFVSLWRSQHSEGHSIHGAPYYTAPNRLYSYDTDFNHFEKLPPLSPQFVYLTQELFLRDWELE